MIFVIDNYLFSAKSFYEKQQSEGFCRPDRQKNPNQEATFMAVAKKPAPKKAVKAPSKPAKPVKTVKAVKPAKKAATRKGAKYGCKACGLVVSVVERLRLCHHGLAVLRNADEEKEAAGQKIKPGCSIPSPESPPLFLTLKKARGWAYSLPFAVILTKNIWILDLRACFGLRRAQPSRFRASDFGFIISCSNGRDKFSG